MGDLIELTTWPNHENIYYEVSSSALVFHVKCTRNAIIGLSRQAKYSCDYWIVISNHPFTYIKKGVGPRIKVRTPDILSSQVYNKFWIAWNGNVIRLGHGDDSNPILTCPNKIPGLRFVTFDIPTRRERTAVHWKFELPPAINPPMLIPIDGGEPHWVRAGDQLPDGAIIGGHENEALYIIRALHMGSMTPGKFVPSLGLGFVSWGGIANEKNEFEVLCGYNLAWVPCHDDKIPVNAVVGGYSEDDGREKLYIGRASHEGNVIPGKVQPSHKVCYFSYNSREVPKTYYEILVVPNGNARYANRHFTYNMEYDSNSEPDHDDDIEYEYGP